MKPSCTEEIFLKDVANHEMTVLLDNGVYRHIRFKNPNSFINHFDIVTYPGYLCYSGDMGSYVFNRLEDMFNFFRQGNIDEGLKINPYYWSEKVEAQCRRDGIKEYSAEKFREVIIDWLDQEEDVTEDLRQAVNDEVLCAAGDGEHEARRVVDDFEHDDFRFRDFWETDLTVYTYRFIWCCYAIVWAIDAYDKKLTPEVELVKE